MGRHRSTAALALFALAFAPLAIANEISWDRGSTDYNPAIKDNSSAPDDLWSTPANWRLNNALGDVAANNYVPLAGDRANIGFVSLDNPVQILTGESFAISSLRVGVVPGLGFKKGSGALSIDGGSLALLDTGTGEGCIIGQDDKTGKIALTGGGSLDIDKGLVISDVDGSKTSQLTLDGAASVLQVGGISLHRAGRHWRAMRS